MNKPITPEDASREISDNLVGCSIDKVTYQITGWELRFIGRLGLDFHLFASEIQIKNCSDWWAVLSGSPIDMQDTNEPNDTIAAMNIFTVINKWPVSGVVLDRENNLELKFENKCSLLVLSHVEHVDWTWQLSKESTNIITCDSGALYGNDANFE